MSRSQIQSQLRQVAARQQRAVDDYNRAVRKYNSGVRRAVDTYNRDVRAHNTKVRANRERLRRELTRLTASPGSTAYGYYQQSVVNLRQSFTRIEGAASAGRWSSGDDVYDLVEGETANSVLVLNALLGNVDETQGPQQDDLQTSTIAAELSAFSAELVARWDGALYALHPKNPDAARHFCTSAREILSAIIEQVAPDEEVNAAGNAYPRTAEGKVTRRARIRYSLERGGIHDVDLEEFVDRDIENVLALFRDFNDGTHGSAGRFDLTQLTAIKRRVEDAVHFLHRIVA